MSETETSILVQLTQLLARVAAMKEQIRNERRHESASVSASESVSPLKAAQLEAKVHLESLGANSQHMKQIRQEQHLRSMSSSMSCSPVKGGSLCRSPVKGRSSVKQNLRESPMKGDELFVSPVKATEGKHNSPVKQDLGESPIKVHEEQLQGISLQGGTTPADAATGSKHGGNLQVCIVSM